MLSSLHYLQGKAADSLVAACSDSAADVMAIAEVGGDRVTITRSDMSVKEVKVPDDADHCSSLALSADGSVLFVGTEGGHLLMSDLKAGSFTMLTLPLTSGTGPATISIDCIARNNDEDIFAVAAAGFVYVIDVKGEVISSLGPLPSPAKRLGWSAGREGNPSSLVALTSEGCYVWASVGEAPSLSIPCQTGDASSLLATTPQSSIVATSCIASCVCCWDLFSLLEARTDAEAEVPPPTMLNEYERQVSCLAWDAEGRYLATSDGADCTVWDMAPGKAHGKGAHGAFDGSQSTMCCGHDQTSLVTCLKFQPDGPLLATASDAGKIAIFDSRVFRRGGVSAPVATAQFGDEPGPANAIAAVHWLTNGCLMVASVTGTLGKIDIMPPELQTHEVEALSGAGATSTVVSASVDYMSPPHTPVEPPSRQDSTPISTPGRLDSGSSAELTGAGGKKQETAVGPRPPGPIRTSPPPSAATAGGKAGTGVSTLAPMLEEPSDSAQSIEAAKGEAQGGGVHTEAVAQQQQQQQTPRSSRKSRGSSGGVGGSGGQPVAMRGPLRQGSSGSSGGGGPLSPSSAGASLMQHIQHLRETPPTPRTAQHEQLTGWGLGISGSAAVPWMAPQGYAMPQAFAVPQGQYPGQQYPFQHPMMASMQPMQPGGMQVPMQVPMPMPMPVPVTPQGFAAAASPRAPRPAGASGRDGPGRPVHPPPPGSPMWQQAPAMVPAPMMGAVPQQWSMPYAQLNVQQAQQWAGIAPGYMSYQHPSAAPHAVPHAAPHAAPAGIPGQPQGVGYGTFHVGSPSAAHAMNNNSSVNGAGAHRSSQHTMSDYEATVVNNEPPRSPQVLRGSKPPPALTPELEAEPVASPRPPADVHLRRPPGWAPPGASPSAGGDEAVTTIYIGNLPPSVDEMALMWTCGYFGPVAHAQIIRDNKTQVSRGYGFVTFAHPAYATVAMQQLNGQVMYGPFGGQKIRVAPTNKHV